MTGPQDWFAIDINVTVRVKLSPKGYQVYERHMACRPGNPLIPNVNAEGWYETELWELAHIFGAALRLGGEPPFASKILVKSET